MPRHRKPKGRKNPVGPARKPTASVARVPAVHGQPWFPWVFVAAVILLTYANAWPDILIFDDREFLASDRFDNLAPSDFIRFFSQSLWEAGANTTALYRPMLLVSLGIENLIFGDWYAGYHLANILRHVLAVMLVFGFLRQVLWTIGHDGERARWVSLLAALVFAVHPVLSDAVNSIFNGSDIYVTIFVIGGLWYLLANQREKPARAWTVAGLCYFFALLYKESAVAMPALAVVVLWLTASNSFSVRFRAVLPVLVLLLPLAIYFGMRASALEEYDSLAAQISPVSAAYAQALGDPEAEASEAKPASNIGRLGLTFDPDRIAGAVSMWSDALRLMIWPHPLATLRGPSQTPLWLAASVQLGLLALCVFALIRNRPEPLLGLLFFYLAILPASRIVGEGNVLPYLLDRMLYLPSVGLAICLAWGFSWLGTRFQPRLAVIVAAAVVLAFMPVIWARNSDWSDEIRLLEHDFSVSENSAQLMFALVRAHAANSNLDGSMKLCTARPDLVEKHSVVSNECAKAFTQARRFDRAEELYLAALKTNPNQGRTHFHLARLYVQTKDWRDARAQFEQAIAVERLPFLREFMSGIMLMDLYPHDPGRLREARQHMENALQLQPRFSQARKALEVIDSRL